MVPELGMMRAMVWFAAAALAAASPAQAQTEPAPAGPITALQQQLKEAGLQPGPVNGVMTEQTKDALAAYQRRHRRPQEALGGGLDPIRRAQAALQRLGMFDGMPDGVVGPATRDAIIRFEASRQMPVDPRVSDRLLAELDTAAGNPPPQAPQREAAPANAPSANTGRAAAPEALGRRPLPPGLNPPPIR